MGRFDILDKRFFEDRERFAELVNREIYHGREVLVPEYLEPLKRKYPSLTSASGEMERDVFMRDIRQDVCYGLEIESGSDRSMPERVMTYDAGEYEYQIREIHKGHMGREGYQDYRDKKSRMKEDDLLMPTAGCYETTDSHYWKRKLLNMRNTIRI